ncbi:hypothetical protein Taro_045218 [Colocasia esculenta]|uniref:Myb/SANT-like domain-containing protein n=1 Tax=Colocasia esculenta TaxID=4460 RepID=A0A843WZS7_COLES|nr:hypothetical protein [Colocasia esculenta]
MVRDLFNMDFYLSWPTSYFLHRFSFYRSYYLTTEDLINVVGFEWDQNGKKIHASELAWQQYMQFNPLAAWFKGRRLSIRNDLINLFKDWGSA